jgi:hypothetical protein
MSISFIHNHAWGDVGRREYRFTQPAQTQANTPLRAAAGRSTMETCCVRSGWPSRAANEGGSMYAVFVEVNAGELPNDQARQAIEGTAVPMAREAGARAGYWLSAEGGRGVAVICFDSGEAARQAADQLKVGEAPPGAPPGVTFRTVEVREVLASL